MTLLLTILTLVIFALFLPKFALVFKFAIELVTLVFYVIALLVIAMITIKSFTDRKKTDSVPVKAIGD